MNTDRTLARASRALATTLQAGLLVTGLTFSTLIAQAQSPAATQSDTQVQSAVTAALAADPQLKGQQVSAAVSQGVVTLSGSVARLTTRSRSEVSRTLPRQIKPRPLHTRPRVYRHRTRVR